ncbi:MAG: hypothetical protein KHY44_13690 [Clostridiales bacterium]|nr:hypothetical protein [Clostridiales bacterium]
MNYPRLREIRDRLLRKSSLTKEEQELLEELKTLNSILNKHEFSLAVASSNCAACGQPL